MPDCMLLYGANSYEARMLGWKFRADSWRLQCVKTAADTCSVTNILYPLDLSLTLYFLSSLLNLLPTAEILRTLMLFPLQKPAVHERCTGSTHTQLIYKYGITIYIQDLQISSKTVGATFPNYQSLRNPRLVSFNEKHYRKSQNYQ